MDIRDEGHELGPYGDCHRFWNSYVPEPDEGNLPIGGGVQVRCETDEDDVPGWVISWVGPILDTACWCPTCKGEQSDWSHYEVRFEVTGKWVIDFDPREAVYEEVILSVRGASLFLSGPLMPPKAVEVVPILKKS
jgi:hypothetical protein